MPTRSQDLFRIFLASHGVQYLDETQAEIARMVADGVSLQQIGTEFSMTRQEIDRTMNRIQRIALREAAKRAKVAEHESLIANLKATKRPLSAISINGGLFSKRVEDALLDTAYARTLRAIVTMGRIVLRSKGIGNGDIVEIENLLAKFGAKLPD